MKKERLSFEWGGRKLEEQEDGSIQITLSREDVLECAVQVYGDFLEGDGEGESFGEYLDNELRKVREERLRDLAKGFNKIRR